MNYKPTHFTNDNGDVLHEAFYRLGREYGYIFKDVIVKAKIDPEKGLKYSIYNQEDTVLAGCNPALIERLIESFDEWLGESGYYYDLEGGEDRWIVSKNEARDEEAKQEIQNLIKKIISKNTPDKAAQLITDTIDIASTHIANNLKNE
jgi:hypothetical protein